MGLEYLGRGIDGQDTEVEEFRRKYTVFIYSIGVCVCVGASMSWVPPMTAHAAHAPNPRAATPPEHSHDTGLRGHRP